MGDTPKITVIIPTYNRAALLPRAVNSVLAQTCQDFELLIVDDGSADDTPAVIAAFDDPRVRSLRHDVNRRLAAARNTGITHARGEYLAFLDDDDEFTADSIASRLAALEAASQDTALVYGWVNEIDDMTGEITERRRHEVEGAEAFEAILRGGFFSMPSAMFVRTSAAKRIGGFNEKLKSAEDCYFLAEITAAYKVIVVREVVVLVHHRHGHPQSVTWGDYDLALEHIAIHRERFANEIKQRPGLLEYLSRDLPAASMRLRAVYEARGGRLSATLRPAVRAFKIQPLSAKNLILPVHLLKGFLFYATPLRRVRRPIQRLLGQRV